MTAALTLTLAHNAFEASREASTPGGDCVERTVITSDGVSLAVRDYGSERADAPTVVLLHGLCLSQESWDPQVCQLRHRWGNRIRIISYDHRGHGRSADASMSTYRIERLAADLAEVLTALRISGPLTLAGHSMGDMTALAYFARPASQRPVEPRGLVLVGTAAGGVAERGLARLLATPATGAVFGFVNHMPRRTTQTAVSTMLRPLSRAMSRWAGNAAVALAADAVRTASLTTATGFLPSLKSFHAYDVLTSIGAKTIIVSGGTDVLTPASHSRDMAAAIPGAIHLHHPAAGHMLMQDASECVGQAIGRAVGMLSRSGRASNAGSSRSCAGRLAVIVS